MLRSKDKVVKYSEMEIIGFTEVMRVLFYKVFKQTTLRYDTNGTHRYCTRHNEVYIRK